MSVDPPEHGAPEQSPTEALAQLEVGRVVPRGLLVAAGWLVIFLLLSAALLHGMVDLSALRGIATEARLGPLAASFLLLFGGLVFMGLRWRALMPRPERVGRAGMVGICASGQLLNMAVPSASWWRRPWSSAATAWRPPWPWPPASTPASWGSPAPP